MDGFEYQLGLGGLVFVIGLIYAARQGYIGRSGTKLRNAVVVVGVALFFVALQAWLQYGDMATAPAGTFHGDPQAVLGKPGAVRGTWLDYAIMIAYFVGIVIVGTWYGRGQRTARDFFFGGQRFSWWLIAFSMVATTVGSYSFVKYSQMGFAYGVSSTQTYFNDWIWLPLLIFGWLPILYFSRVTSIPEYFGRRFGHKVRFWATVLTLVYLIGYVGINLYTMGVVLHKLVGWPVPLSALLVAVISCSYVTAGGQTSVIMTDLFQGIMLLVAGLLILFLGMHYLGGPAEFWHHLPREARQAFPPLTRDPEFPAAGIFWQDAIANSAMFYFLNQGILMRLVAARSVNESRKAVVATVLVLMTIAAVVVASGGWVARALVHAGALPPTVKADDAFFVATRLLAKPGVFGLVLAALTAALMSTVDTLITAIAAVAVNDVYRVYIRKDASETQLLAAARWVSVLVTVLGVSLVPVFMSFQSIYAAHGAFTAAVTPPLVVALLLGVFWHRFNRHGAWWTIVGGTVAIAASIVWPVLVEPFAHGVPAEHTGSGVLAGMNQYHFMRALFGLAASTAFGVVATLVTPADPAERRRGLVWGGVADALRRYKGTDGEERDARTAVATPVRGTLEPPRRGEGQLPAVRLSAALAEALAARAGDLLYVTDRRWWTGGLHSSHAVVAAVDLDAAGAAIELGPQTHGKVVTRRRAGRPLRVERLY